MARFDDPDSAMAAADGMPAPGELDDAEIQRGVDEGYQQHIDEMRSREAAIAAHIAQMRLDKDDLARIADALQIAWDAANRTAQENPDRAVRSVVGGMRGAYGETLAKVEQMLDPDIAF